MTRPQTGSPTRNPSDSSMKTGDSLTLTIFYLHSFYMQKLNVLRSRTSGLSSYTNNAYYIAASCGELDPKKMSVRVGLPAQ